MGKIIKEARRKVIKANENATEDMKLCNRTSSALEWLLTSKNLAHILQACNALSVCTKLSKECCVAFLNTNAVDVIFALVKSCNRSEPHIKVLEAALVTL